ncbi:hypothetical protein [Defluviitalea phaphyphila]|uniref:hypothetical protein n=1 Tax=Defluviitalea phaphyphila TaxID=1473580 RepID=UPI000731225E|nr:hypothetical protein [Defluviitalea phaphyphila]
MKIYHKKNFSYGLFNILLAITFTILNTIQEFKIRTLIFSIFCLFFGILLIIGSMSREMTKEDIINELDERNQLINLKSRSKSLSLTQKIGFAIMLLFLIISKLYNYNILLYVALGIAISHTISLITEICTTIYYEHKN